ncbi:GMC oxidoreductase [Methylocystis heyeri]|uniref:FAD-dependent oxidoreductase n=1 Tax=Methylocystis heyeri TaxID=391905 RepID=A0A6B8KE02_9HYPH|nr:GMC oxidoreductase [Methylocystis heyeri]QGM46674.1 FAD-dependent oxidoreductase [Methylocystis heyeri]
MHYVIGSGPAGVACARALAASGRPVTILDAGHLLEAEREGARSRLAHRDHYDAIARERNFGPGAVLQKQGAVPRKLAFGSDYPYRKAPGAANVAQSTDLCVEGSYARGGLSNVWGGAILPYRQSDIADWPISAEDLHPFYNLVAKFLPVAAEPDDLEHLFPLATELSPPLRCGAQSERFRRALADNKARLNAAGVYFGASRLAVDAHGVRGQAPCIYCGQCLHGCPRELIYTSRHGLSDLCARGGVAYRSGVVVKSIEERADSSIIRAVAFDGTPCSFEAKRAFLAAGPLHSTEILLRSLGLYDHAVHLRDSQYFLFPLLQFTGAKDVSSERQHTLAQTFMEILDAGLGDKTVHLQIYAYNDHISRLLDEKLGRLRRYFPGGALLGRLLLVQGYLHSSLSATIATSLHACGKSDELRLNRVENPQTKPKIMRLLSKLAGLSWPMRAFPVAPLLRIAEAGRGFHFGGSFPMARDPGPGQTDLLGRPFGFRRLHVVDATVFPSIAATTITYTAMANAYRIGARAAFLDEGSLQ